MMRSPTILETVAIAGFFVGPMVTFGATDYAHRKSLGELVADQVAQAVEAEFKSLERDADELNRAAARFERAQRTLCSFPFTRQNILFLQARGEIEEICK